MSPTTERTQHDTPSDASAEEGMVAFGRRLSALRTECGLGLREAARQAGISAGYLTDLEHGRRLPSIELLQRLAEQYGLVAVDLLDGIAPWGRPT